MTIYTRASRPTAGGCRCWYPVGMAKAPEAPTPQVLRILWGAMLFSHGLFLLVGYMVYGQNTGQGGDTQVLSLALTGAGVVTALASALIVPIITRKQVFYTAMILRFALAESVTIFGLTLAMLGADMQWTYALTGLGVLAHVAAFPTEREREAHERRRAGSS